jgi:hypothetical protein
MEKICLITVIIGILFLWLLLYTATEEGVSTLYMLQTDGEQEFVIQGKVLSVRSTTHDASMITLKSCEIVPVYLEQNGETPTGLIDTEIDVKGKLGGNKTDPLVYASAIRLR